LTGFSPSALCPAAVAGPVAAVTAAAAATPRLIKLRRFDLLIHIS
jgi:hypothetical protein